MILNLSHIRSPEHPFICVERVQYLLRTFFFKTLVRNSKIVTTIVQIPTHDLAFSRNTSFKQLIVYLFPFHLMKPNRKIILSIKTQ